MEYTHYDSSQPESMFPAADPGHQVPSSFPMDRSQSYHTGESAPIGSNYEAYEDRQGYRGTGLVNPEEGGDTANRSRLTQEQLVHLEREFQQHHKPNTEHKRALAEAMAVDFAKVNNWFQNRRAKAKHENQPRIDSSTEEEAAHVLAAGYPLMDYRRMQESQHAGYYSSPEQIPAPLGDFATSLDFDGFNDLQPQYLVPSGGQNANVAGLPVYSDNEAFRPNILNVAVTDHPTMWQTNHSYADSTEKMPTPQLVELDPLALSSDSPPVQSYNLQSTHGNNGFHSQPMYHNTLDGQMAGNPSSQSFVTSPSEEGEQANFITPPQETSPLPGLNQATFQHDRRASDSSDLATNFDTIHLQQPQVGVGLYGASNTASAPNLTSNTGLLTPDVSPDSITNKTPFSQGHDLASRRKRPRPAALQPNSNRSVSCAGPLTSPHLRVSPPASGNISPVRRIKSTGNNLNVKHGRIRKPGTISAQMSPRTFKSNFQAAVLPEAQPSPGMNAHTRQTSSAIASTVSLSPSASFVPQSQATRPDSPSQFPLASSNWEQSTQGNAPFTYAPESGFYWPPLQPTHSYPIAPTTFEQATHPSQYGYHCPPQSAPSHLTTFFDGPSSMATNVSTGWPTQTPTSPERYRDDTHISMQLRPNHPHHHSHSGPLGSFPPHAKSFQCYPPGMTSFQPYQQLQNRTPIPVQKTLDIKIDIGPAPPKELAQASQEQKVYTFNNSFSETFPATNAKK